jgi:hypothetical protein
MAVRLWTALLMLAAVFALHGVQCAADVGSVAMTALIPRPAHVTTGVAGLDDPMPAHTTATADVAAAAAPAGHGGAPHDWAARLWTACPRTTST